MTHWQRALRAFAVFGLLMAAHAEPPILRIQEPPVRRIPSYDELVKASHERLKAGDAAGALLAVEEAIKLDGRRFEAYVQGAIVAGRLGDNTEMRTFLQHAIERAPADKKEGLRLLLDEMQTADDGAYARHLASAKDALSKNLFAKAGNEFETAWRLAPQDPAPALSAAAAFVRIEDWTRAGMLLREAFVKAQSDKQASVKEAIGQLQPKLDAHRDAQLAQAQSLYEGSRFEEARKPLESALAIDPDCLGGLYLEALVCSALDEPDAAVTALTQCVSLGMIDRASLVDNKGLHDLRGGPGYVALIDGVLGPEVAEEIKRVPISDSVVASISQWAEILDIRPSPAVVTNAKCRIAIKNSGLPWRIKHKRSGIELLLVPPGKFFMGASANDLAATDIERPERLVEITKPYYLGRYEVTDEEWARVFGFDEVAWEQHHGVPLSEFLASGGSVRLPATADCWSDIRGKGGFLEKAGDGLRLPTEAEWEFACRGGACSRGILGVEIDEIAWCRSNSGGEIHQVGLKWPNALGFYDMLGNREEWCEDLFDRYPERERPPLDPSVPYRISSGPDVRDPLGPPSSKVGNVRVLRGGWYDAESKDCRASSRGGMDAGKHWGIDRFGFRVARSP